MSRLSALPTVAAFGLAVLLLLLHPGRTAAAAAASPAKGRVHLAADSSCLDMFVRASPCDSPSATWIVEPHPAGPAGAVVVKASGGEGCLVTARRQLALGSCSKSPGWTPVDMQGVGRALAAGKGQCARLAADGRASLGACDVGALVVTPVPLSSWTSSAVIAGALAVLAFLGLAASQPKLKAMAEDGTPNAFVKLVKGGVSPQHQTPGGAASRTDAATPAALAPVGAAEALRAARGKLSLDQAPVEGARVVLRLDLNVPLTSDGSIANDHRIRAAVPGVTLALERGAKAVVILSHLGRPDGRPNPKMSLKPVAAALGKLLKKEVVFVPHCAGPEAEAACADPPPGTVLVMENVRFHAEEEGKGVAEDGAKVKATPEAVAAFRASLSKLGDVFCMDAFGAAHRAHSSISGMALPVRCCGPLMAKELAFVGGPLLSPRRPFTAVVGGAKVSDKIRLISNLLEVVDELVIGGAMAMTFKKAAFGVDIGASLFDEEGASLVPQLLAKAKDQRVRLHLPIDYITADKFAPDARLGVADDVTGVGAGLMALDIGPKSAHMFATVVRRAALLVWNGPMGVFEFDRFAGGSKALMDAAVEATAAGSTTVIGGGDTATCATKFGVEHKLTHVSTGGGAALELLEGKLLPGVEALSDAPEGSEPLFPLPSDSTKKAKGAVKRASTLARLFGSTPAKAKAPPKPSPLPKGTSDRAMATPAPPKAPATPAPAAEVAQHKNFGPAPVGLHGFGRTNRLALRAALTTHAGKVEVVAINAPGCTPEAMAYLVNHDSTQGALPADRSVTASADGCSLVINNKVVPVTALRSGADVPWGAAGAEYVLDETTQGATPEGAATHLAGGALKVLVAGTCADTPVVCPASADATPSSKPQVLSLGPFEAHAALPVLKAIHEMAGIEACSVSAVCSAGEAQKTVDGPDSADWRAGRGFRQNIVPGPSRIRAAVDQALPALAGRVSGCTFRVPTAAVGAVDLTARLTADLDLEDLYAKLARAAEGKSTGAYLGVVREQVVSTDFVGDSRSCVVDAGAGIQLSPRLVKVVVWSDAEWAYAQRALDAVAAVCAVDRGPGAVFARVGSRIQLAARGDSSAPATPRGK